MVTVFASQEPEWKAARVKPCDRACLPGVMDAYMNAIYKHDPKLVPALARDYRMTENTGVMEVGEGMLWRRTMQPTTFNLYIADPINGQVALQARVMMQGQNTLIAVRLKIDRGRIQEIEHLWAANSNFDALGEDNGKIAAFAKDCVRHGNGYQTVNNPPPGGRNMPGPALPDPNTAAGKRRSHSACKRAQDAKEISRM